MSGASDLNHAEIVQDYLTMCNLKKVARKHHRSVTVIKQVLVEQGVEIKHRFTPEHLADQREIQSRDETRAKHRELWISQHAAKAKANPIHTPIEKRLHDALTDAGLSFETQARIGDSFADIRLLDYPIVIEADGHDHLRKQVQERDAKKDAERAVLGFVIFRFTGREINADATACVAIVREYITQAIASERWEQPEPHPPIVRLGNRKGENAPFWGGRLSDEQRAKISERMKGNKLSDEIRAKISATLKGRRLPDETKAKLSEALTGRQLPTEQRAKMAESRRSYYREHPPQPKTDEERTRIREGIARSSYQRTPEHQAKLAEARRGKSHSPETKALISAKVRAARKRKAGRSDEDIVRPDG